MKQSIFTLLSVLFTMHSFSQAGSPLTTFGSSGSASTTIGSGSTTVDMAVQSDAKIIVAAYASVGGNSDFALSRYKQDGTLDLSFNNTGKVTTAIGASNDYLNAIAVQNDGKIVAVGYCMVGSVYNIGVARYLPNGTPDATFDGDGKLLTSLGTTTSTTGRDVAVQNDGKIIVVGSYNNNMIVLRYNSDGTLDTSFDVDGIVSTSFGASTSQSAMTVALQGDGKIVVGGMSQNQFALVRYNTDGSLDTSFDTDGKVTTTINASGSSLIYHIVIQSDGSIIAGGRYTFYDNMSDNNASNVALAKYTTSGALVPGFDGDGKLTFAINAYSPMDEARSVAVQGDSKILVTGMGFTAVRLNANGSFDNSFDGDGKITGSEGSAVKLWSNRVYVANWTGGVGLRAFQNDVTVLPLHLTGFQAEAVDKRVDLHWQTSAEKNTSKFVVERSADGLTFSPVGELAAAGNSAGSNYHYSDRQPLTGKSYYRLKMIDADNAFTYSKVVWVNLQEVSALQLQATIVSNKVNIQVNGHGASVLLLTDYSGRILKQQTLLLNGITTHEMEVHSLPAGQYFLTLQTKGQLETKPFFKQ
jgi:uncharacterized delta-60 repeat protein